MSVTKLRSLLTTAVADRRITKAEVDGLAAGLNPRGMSNAEKTVLTDALRRNATMFEPEAKTALMGLLGVAPVPPPPSAATTEVTFVYDAGTHPLTNLKLNGSWDRSTGAFAAEWAAQPIPMRSLGDGKWEAKVSILDDGQPHDWQWGVVADGPTGKGQWAVMGERNLRFKPDGAQASYAPTTYHQMGAQRSGSNDLSFKLWAPNAKEVVARVTTDDGKILRVPLTRDGEGNWSGLAANKYQALVGAQYVYEITDSTGARLERPDPYARQMMGEQRGLSRAFFDPGTGKEVHPFAASKSEFMRFEIGNEAIYDRAYLVLKSADGKPLNKQQVLDQLGRLDPALLGKIQQHRGVNDLGALNVEDDGRIRMQNEGGTWTTLLQDPQKLLGLRYELQIWSKDPSGRLYLHDDKNRDNVFSEAERKASPNNDRYSDVITEKSGISFRGSVITDNRFDWKSDAVPRENDHARWVTYQLHVGSFFGMEMNSKRSTFEDITQRLDYLKGLGINTLELLPVNEVEGQRDWGYMGASSLAVESAYGFEDKSGKWVTGTEALKAFIDEAHKRGLNVVNDVVYNHVGGADNFLWNMDGKENPYFDWAQDPSHPQTKETPWGAMPAFDNPKVKQLYVDHAVAQVEELHFDGLRFDFTEPIKGQGGKDGWELLREINRQLHFYRPEVFTVAEQFDYDPSIARPSRSDGTGGGFDAQWYTEFQHRLVNDSAPFNPGLVQAAARGWKTDMDKFIGSLTGPRGIDSWKNALTIISNHDEVGNAQRTITTAMGDKVTSDPPQWARNAARFAAGIGLASPGMPMFFQGEESQASNEFKWGNPATWDTGWTWESLGQDWDWNKLTFNDEQRKKYERLFGLSPAVRDRDPDYVRLPAADKQVFDDLAAMSAPDRARALVDIPRRQSVDFFRDAIALRHSSRAFDADAAVERVYTHNDNSVLAFSRKKDGDEMLVVGSLNHQPFHGYGMDLPPGKWKEVFNSDSGRYGGSNVGNGGGTFGSGRQNLEIPAAGYLVLKRVG
jgi:maltooligosyltrehalose trehalohydrolase